MAWAQTTADLLAVCRADTEAVASRIVACSRIINQKGDDEIRAEAFLQRGVLHEMGGEKQSAVNDYSEAIKLDDSNALTFFNRGNAYDQLGQFDLAIADYTQAIKLDPTDPDFFNNRGQTYDGRSEHDLAIADYTEAIRLDPKMPGPTTTAASRTPTRATIRAPSTNSTRRSSCRRRMRTCTSRAAPPMRNWAISRPPGTTTAGPWKSSPTTRMPRKD